MLLLLYDIKRCAFDTVGMLIRIIFTEHGRTVVAFSQKQIQHYRYYSFGVGVGV